MHDQKMLAEKFRREAVLMMWFDFVAINFPSLLSLSHAPAMEGCNSQSPHAPTWNSERVLSQHSFEPSQHLLFSGNL
jgi:hypothetical protein